NRSEARTPAASRLASAASVQSGRAVRVARQTTTFAKVPILTSPILGPKSIQIGEAVACQFVWVAFTGLPFSAYISLERAATLVGRINIVVRRQVHGPGPIDCASQRRIVAHF